MKSGVSPPGMMLVDNVLGNVVEADESALHPGLNATEGKDEYKFKLSGALLTDGGEVETDGDGYPKLQPASDRVWDVEEGKIQKSTDVDVFMRETTSELRLYPPPLLTACSIILITFCCSILSDYKGQVHAQRLQRPRCYSSRS